MVVDETQAGTEVPDTPRPEASADPSSDIYTAANVITVLRLILVPISFAVLVTGKNDVVSFILFALAASTDWLDGQIARRTGTVTVIGKAIDPLVDRLLIAAGVLGLYLIGRLPLWIVLVLVTRDVLLLYGLWRLDKAGRQLSVTYIGKATTAVLLTGFSLLILNWPQVPGLGIDRLSGATGLGERARRARHVVHLRRHRAVDDLGGHVRVHVRARAASAPNRQRNRSVTVPQRRLARRYHVPRVRTPTESSRLSEPDYRPSTRSSSRSNARSSSRGRSKRGSGGSGVPSRGLLIAVVAVAAVVLLAGIAEAVASAGRVHPGVTVAGVKVGGLSEAGARLRIERELNSRMKASPVVFTLGEQVVEGHRSHCRSVRGLRAPLPTQAMAVGRSGGLFVALGDRLRAWVKPVDLPAQARVDETKTAAFLTSVGSEVAIAPKDAVIKIKGVKMSLAPSKPGRELWTAPRRVLLTAGLLAKERTFDGADGRGPARDR